MKFLILPILILFLKANIVFANSSELKEVYCNSSNIPILENKNNTISYNDKDFSKILGRIDKSFLDKKYNLIVSLGSRPSGGYKLKFNKMKNKNKKKYIYFNEIKPPKNSKNVAVISYPFCLVKIDNLNEYKVKIRKKSSKFFPFSIFN